MSEPASSDRMGRVARLLAGREREAAGVVLLASGGQFLLFLLVAAAMRPGYSLHANAISDLGVGATAALFNASVVLSGLGNAAAGVLYYRAHGRRWLLALFLAAGAGAVGVGVFPETTGAPHRFFALLAFVGLNFQGIACAERARGLVGALGVLAGLLGLGFLVLLIVGAARPGLYDPIGYGGVERLIVYPVVLWLAAFAGVLVGADRSGDGEAV